MPLLIPIAMAISTALTVKTLNGTIKKIEKKKARRERRNKIL
ncbi:hypothetical protein ACMC56_01440 [Campylobacterota bacterium DY0563]|nr:hypothetical protein [Halarcobacter sp.]